MGPQNFTRSPELLWFSLLGGPVFWMKSCMGLALSFLFFSHYHICLKSQYD